MPRPGTGVLLPQGKCGLPIRMALPEALFVGAIAQPFEPPRVSLRATTVPVEQPGVKLHATSLALEMSNFCQTEINAGRLSWLGMEWRRDLRRDRMKRFVEGMDRGQSTLFPECLEDWICVDNPVRVIDVFVGGLDLAELRFCGVDPEATGRPSYHPSVLLKLSIYGYLNRVQSSHRLEREACRNVEVMWLAGRLVPDHKTIADFRKDNGPAIRKVCAQFVAVCREIGLCRRR